MKRIVSSKSENCKSAVTRLTLAYGYDEDLAWEEVKRALTTSEKDYINTPIKQVKYNKATLNRAGRRLVWSTVHEG
jgi:hypothetical protein